MLAAAKGPAVEVSQKSLPTAAHATLIMRPSFEIASEIRWCRPEGRYQTVSEPHVCETAAPEQATKPTVGEAPRCEEVGHRPVEPEKVPLHQPAARET